MTSRERVEVRERIWTCLLRRASALGGACPSAYRVTDKSGVREVRIDPIDAMIVSDYNRQR